MTARSTRCDGGTDEERRCDDDSVIVASFTLGRDVGLAIRAASVLGWMGEGLILAGPSPGAREDDCFRESGRRQGRR